MGLAEVLREEIRWPLPQCEALERTLLAHLADVLGSDETREVVLRGTCTYDPKREEPHHTCTLAADAALVAVREVLGLSPGVHNRHESDERTEVAPEATRDAAGASAGFRGDGDERVVELEECE